MKMFSQKEMYKIWRLFFTGFILVAIALLLALGMGLTKMSVEIVDLTLMGIGYIAVVVTIASLAVGYAALKLRKMK